MVDFHDPLIINEEYASLVKLWHVLDGVFIWEFFTTLYFEWDVIRGRRPYCRTLWIYTLTRVATLLAIILNLIGFNNTTQMHCQVWVIFQFLFVYIAFAAASLLIVLRVIAIWNKEKIVVSITMGVWLVNVALLLEGLIRIRSTWLAQATTCTLLNLETNNPAVISILATDVVLLVLMIVGLVRVHREAADGVIAMGRILWKQGVAWLIAATLTAIPHVVFVCLNLNLPMNYMFQAPNMIVLAIASTRMYRSLDNRSTPRSTPRTTKRTVISDMRVRTVPLSQTDGSVPTSEFGQYSTSQSGSSYVSNDPNDRYKAHEVSLNVDVESGVEK